MRKNYFTTAARSLARNRNYAILNISGLTMGIAAFLVIAMIIQFETGFDRHHRYKDRIHRVLTVNPGDNKSSNTTPDITAALPAEIKAGFPNLVVAAISAYPAMPVSILNSDGVAAKSLKADVFFTEPAFFDIFDVELAAGDPRLAIGDPKTAVMSKKTATLFFGDWRSAIGRDIKVGGNMTVRIGAVIDDAPDQSEFQLKLILPNQLLKHDMSNNLTSISGSQQCYVMLPDGTDENKFNQQLKLFRKKQPAGNDHSFLQLQPLSNVHYDAGNKYRGVGNFSGNSINGSQVRLLWVIAIFILVIACINFIKLITAQAIKRTKEMVVQKVEQHNKIQLMLRFLAETFLMVIFAIIVAMFFAWLLAGSLGVLIDMPVELTGLPMLFLFAFAGIVLVSVTLFAGISLAVVLSRNDSNNVFRTSINPFRTRGIGLSFVYLCSGKFEKIKWLPIKYY